MENGKPDIPVQHHGQQTIMAALAVEKALNMYSRDRKKAQRYMASKQRQIDLTLGRNSSDEIINGR